MLLGIWLCSKSVQPEALFQRLGGDLGDHIGKWSRFQMKKMWATMRAFTCPYEYHHYHTVHFPLQVLLGSWCGHSCLRRAEQAARERCHCNQVLPKINWSAGWDGSCASSQTQSLAAESPWLGASVVSYSTEDSRWRLCQQWWQRLPDWAGVPLFLFDVTMQLWVSACSVRKLACCSRQVHKASVVWAILSNQNQTSGSCCLTCLRGQFSLCWELHCAHIKGRTFP